jgi:Niemann-Pick C1 protein
MFGITQLKITTDPVELWASPTSRSRIEKNYFDQTFGPFYRIEHIIITAKGLGTVMHNTSDGEEEFGPVFNKKFMYAVLDFQRKIETTVRCLLFTIFINILIILLFLDPWKE